MWYVKKIKLLSFGFFAVLLLVLPVTLLSGINPAVRHTMSQKTQCEIRNDLLLQTISEMGMKSDEDAVDLWVKGTKARNGAMQAAAMDSVLQASYLTSLSQIYPNWVTAFSSPWIASYEIEKIDGEDRRYKVRFITETSSGYDNTYEAKVTLTTEKDFPRIREIDMDEGLKAYTGF